jgi:hypothetical protein
MPGPEERPGGDAHGHQCPQQQVAAGIAQDFELESAHRLFPPSLATPTCPGRPRISLPFVGFQRAVPFGRRRPSSPLLLPPLLLSSPTPLLPPLLSSPTPAAPKKTPGTPHAGAAIPAATHAPTPSYGWVGVNRSSATVGGRLIFAVIADGGKGLVEFRGQGVGPWGRTMTISASSRALPRPCRRDPA